jgi:hypothetical protein
MTNNIVVMPGPGRVDLSLLRSVARDFEWEVDVFHDFREAAVAQAYRKTGALLFHRDALGSGCSWLEAIRVLRLAVPDVRLIPCHGFSELVDWQELSVAGAFHALWLPLRENEVRRTLGFVWGAEKRRAGSGETPSRIVPAPGLRVIQRITSNRSLGVTAPSMARAAG